eukprot:10464517-Karenia_brevis.AAC.1
MQVVSRRRSRFERNKHDSRISNKINFVSQPTCQCEDKQCSRVKWIQPVEKEDPQRMILDFQVAE